MNDFLPGFKRFALSLLLLAVFGAFAAYGAPTKTATYKASWGEGGDIFASVAYTDAKAEFGVVLKEYPVSTLPAGLRSTTNNTLRLEPHFAFSIEIVDGSGKKYVTNFQNPLVIKLSFPKATNFFILNKDKTKAILFQDLKKDRFALPDSEIEVQELSPTSAVIAVHKWVAGDPCCGG
jgi:hypothetical protein